MFTVLDKFIKLIYEESEPERVVLSYKKLISEVYEDIQQKLKDKFYIELEKVVESLIKLNRPVNFPYEVIPVPCIKFTKNPVMKWEGLQELDTNDLNVIELRKKCSAIGLLLNYSFILKGFCIVDIDIVDENSVEKTKDSIYRTFKDYLDVETRRGFHKIFFFEDGEGILIKYKRGKEGQYTKTFVTTIHVPEGGFNIDVKSTRRFLGTFPEASHYLVLNNKNKLIARKYKAISVASKQFCYSCSVELFKAKPSDVKDFVINVVKEFNSSLARSLNNNLEVELVDKTKYAEIVKTIGVEKVPENVDSFSLSVSLYSFDELLKKLRSVRDKLPNCVYKIFFEKIPKGYCYAFARLLASFIFYLVKCTDSELEKIANYFVDRFESFKRPRKYYWKYFGCGIKPVGSKIGFPSTFGIGREVFDYIYELARCETCKYRDICLYYNKFVRGKEHGFTVRKILINLLSI